MPFCRLQIFLHAFLLTSNLWNFLSFNPSNLLGITQEKLSLGSKRWLMFDPDTKWVNNQINLGYDSPSNFPKKNHTIKGKVIDAMRNGTPCVLSEIAAEGIFNASQKNAFISSNETHFIEKAVELYTDENIWTSMQSKGLLTLKSRFLAKDFYLIFIKRIQFLETNFEAHRLQNFTGILLQHHSMQSSKYFSKWIEAKNKGL